MKLYLVRHGETDWNKTRRIQGQADIPLNEFGRSLAVKTAAGLRGIPFAVCFCSPLGRAVETAGLIIAGRDVPVIKDERIAEMAFGEWEGKCCSKEGWELPERFQAFFNDPVNYEPAEGGEDFAAVRARVGDFLSWLSRQREYEGKNILIATHGAALAGMLNYMKKKPLAEYWGQGVHKNCAVTEVEAAGGKFRILSENKAYYDDDVRPWQSYEKIR